MQFALAGKYFEISKKQKNLADKGLYEEGVDRWCKTARTDANAVLKEKIDEMLKEVKQPATKGNLVDLMKMIDINKDVVSGKWKMQDGKLVCEASNMSRLELPYQPSEEYDFQVKFTPQDSNISGIMQILYKSGHSFAWSVGGWGNKAYGFDMIDGKSGLEHQSTIKKDKCLEKGRTYTSTVKIRKDHVEGYVDGQLIVNLKTNYDNLQLYKDIKLKNESTLGLFSPDTNVVYHNIELIEVTGKGIRKR